MKDVSLRVKKLRLMLAFLMDRRTDGRTDGRTDRVITIGHPPSGRALITHLNRGVRWAKRVCLLPESYLKTYNVYVLFTSDNTICLTNVNIKKNIEVCVFQVYVSFSFCSNQRHVRKHCIGCDGFCCRWICGDTCYHTHSMLVVEKVSINCIYQYLSFASLSCLRCSLIH